MPQSSVIEEVVGYVSVEGGPAVAVVVETVGVTSAAEQGPAGRGFRWLGAWAALTAYAAYDVVSFGGSAYIALAASTGITPGTDGTKWEVFAGGGTGNDLSYTHTQLVASASWTVTHGLGKKPSVTVVDSADNVHEGDVEYVDLNTVEISFSAPFSGTAYLN